jgi:hypothetical protein
LAERPGFGKPRTTGLARVSALVCESRMNVGRSESEARKNCKLALAQNFETGALCGDVSEVVGSQFDVVVCRKRQLEPWKQVECWQSRQSGQMGTRCICGEGDEPEERGRSENDRASE